MFSTCVGVCVRGVQLRSISSAEEGHHQMFYNKIFSRSCFHTRRTTLYVVHNFHIFPFGGRTLRSEPPKTTTLHLLLNYNVRTFVSQFISRFFIWLGGFTITITLFALEMLNCICMFVSLFTSFNIIGLTSYEMYACVTFFFFGICMLVCLYECLLQSLPLLVVNCLS